MAEHLDTDHLDLGHLDFGHIGAGLGEPAEPLRLILHDTDEPSDVGRALTKVAEAIAAAAPAAVTVERGGTATPPARPALTLAQGDQANIHYLCLPEGREAPPFVEALTGMAHRPAAPDEPWQAELAALTQPAELLVFVSPACPHCAQAVQAANRLALHNAKVTTSIVDVQRFPALAKQFSVASVPLTVVDGALSLTGVVQPAKLVEHLLARGGAAAEAQVFQAYIETGRIDAATAALVDGSSPQHLVTAWRKSTTSTRMGLMLAVEEALEENRQCLDGIVDDLIPVLQAEDTALQGDTADLLGRIGLPAAIEPIKALLSHTNEDVAEIAQEALEEIEERGEG